MDIDLVDRLRRNRPADTDDLLAEAAERIEVLESALYSIVQWSRAYPLKAFPEPDWKQAAGLLRSGGMSLDAIAADCTRHVIEGVGKIAAAPLAGLLPDDG